MINLTEHRLYGGEIVRAHHPHEKQDCCGIVIRREAYTLQIHCLFPAFADFETDVDDGVVLLFEPAPDLETALEVIRAETCSWRRTDKPCRECEYHRKLPPLPIVTT